MDAETERICPSCGKQVKAGAAFCTYCGAALGVAEEAAAAAPPTGEPAPEQEETTQPLPQAAETATPVPLVPPTAGVAAAPGFVPRTSPKSSKLPLLVGLAGGILVIAGIALLVLWLTVWNSGGGGSGDPISLAEKYINAMEKGDFDGYLGCFEEGYMDSYMEDNPVLEGMGVDIEEMMRMTFDMMEVEFEDYALEIESEGEQEATVVTTRGTATLSVMGFEQVYDLSEEPMVFEMIEEGGSWYLTRDPMPGSMGGDMDFDMGDLEEMEYEDFDLEDMSELLPEEMDLEDLEDMSSEDLEKMLEELEQLMEDLPEESST
jgi:hypothetical protein